jgi:hypothetical protein
MTGRFDRDSVPDLAVACRDSKAAGVFRGNGDGTFGPVRRQLVQDPMFPPRERMNAVTAAAPRQGRGALLAFGVDKSDRILVMRDFANGVPRRQMQYEVGWNPTSLTTGCFTNPCRRDLVVSVRNFDPMTDGPSISTVGGPGLPVAAAPRGEVVILREREDGTFADPMRLTVGYRPSLVKAADLNGDGLDDLVVVNQGEKRIDAAGFLSVFLARGDGSFEPERRVLEGAAFSSVVLADFDRDGHLDLAAGTPGGEREGNGTVALWFGAGDGSFGRAERLDSTWWGGCLATGDFDEDGRPDLVEVSKGSLGYGPYAPGSTVLYSSRSVIAAGKGREIDAGPTLCVDVNDFDGDRRPDLAVLNWSHEISILLGGPGGTFEPRLRFATAGPADLFAAADVDGDGRADLAAGVPFGVSILMNAARSR